MSPAPGTQIKLRDTPVPASIPTDTTTWFVTGISEKGPLTPIRVKSVSEFEHYFGLRVSYGILWDCVDTFFREGGTSVYVSRVVGPSPTSGFKNLLDGVAATSLIVTAIGPGAYSSTQVFVGVVAGTAGGTYQIVITDGTNILEQSGDLSTQIDAVQWALLSSDYVRIAVGGSALIPVVAAPAALSAGNDDRANIVEAQWTNALNLFTAGYGPGQVSAPGRTTDIAHTTLLAHAQANRRVAILDLTDTATAATLKTSVVNCRVGNQRYGAAFTPWVQVSGIVPGTLRTLPPSPFVAGMISKNELERGPNSPSAGNNGISHTAIGLSQPPFTEGAGGTREDLNNNGINVIMKRPSGLIETFGWRSIVNAVTDPNWINFGNVRLYMAIASDADQIAETFVFRVIDGKGQTISEFNGALVGMLMLYYQQGGLYGLSADLAFNVDTGAQVNTPITISNNELHAVLNVKMSPFAEFVVIEIVKTPLTLEVI
jgi:hypothetical protein